MRGKTTIRDAAWHKPGERLVIRDLRQTESWGGGSAWEGLDQRGRRVRLAFVWGHVSLGAGTYPDGGLYGTLLDAEKLEARTADLEEVKRLIRLGEWPVEFA